VLVFIGFPDRPEQEYFRPDCAQNACGTSAISARISTPVASAETRKIPSHVLRVLGSVSARQEHQPAEQPGHKQVDKANEHKRRA
jgi:hypothetical protein